MDKDTMYYLTQYWTDVADKRTKHLLFLNFSTPWMILSILINYVIYSKFAGPMRMARNKPYDLRRTMLVYNITMAVLNGMACIRAIIACDYGRRFLIFSYPDFNDMSPIALTEIHLGYLYWLTKFFDLFDTVLFVLRKKYTHITFLHVYHHAVVPMFGWLCFIHNPLLPGGVLFTIINSFVHVVMYTYYALAAMGPSVRKYLWWKKYLTVMQLWQFVIFGIYGVLLFIYQTGYPSVWLYLGLSQPPIFFYLFYDFYIKAYRQRTRKIDIPNGIKKD